MASSTGAPISWRSGWRGGARRAHAGVLAAHVRHELLRDVHGVVLGRAAGARAAPHASGSGAARRADRGAPGGEADAAGGGAAAIGRALRRRRRAALVAAR